MTTSSWFSSWSPVQNLWKACKGSLLPSYVFRNIFRFQLLKLIQRIIFPFCSLLVCIKHYLILFLITGGIQDKNEKNRPSLKSLKTDNRLEKSKYKPLCGKIFYLDLPSITICEKLQKDIKDLGGVSENCALPKSKKKKLYQHFKDFHFWSIIAI